MKIKELETRMTFWYALHRKLILVGVMVITFLLFSSALYLDKTPKPINFSEQKENEKMLQVDSLTEPIPEIHQEVSAPIVTPTPKRSEEIPSKTQEKKELPISPQEPIVTTNTQKAVTEEEVYHAPTYIRHNSVTRTVPKQYVNVLIPGKQVISEKHPKVRVQLLAPLQLAKITLPKGAYLDGVAQFESNTVQIIVNRVRHQQKNYPVDIWITDQHGQQELPLKKSKLKFNNTMMIVETR